MLVKVLDLSTKYQLQEYESELEYIKQLHYKTSEFRLVAVVLRPQVETLWSNNQVVWYTANFA